MAVYRSDHAQVTFAAEAAQGGDPEILEVSVSGASTDTDGAFNAGSRAITLTDASSLTVGDFITIGDVNGTPVDTVDELEVRRVEAISGNVVTLDRPTAFYHGDEEDVKEATAVAYSTSGSNLSVQNTRQDKSKFISWIPGIYETIDTPDPEMTIEGKRFLGTQSKRAWNVAYPGQQTLSGSISGIILLNGWPLRFPIGSVVTTPSATTSRTNTDGAVKKGDIYVTVNSISNLAVGDYIQIDNGSATKSEVRRIIHQAGGSDLTLRLNYPLQFDHDDNVTVHEVTHSTSIVYTHKIIEQTELDTMTWHVHMRDTGESSADEAANRDFDRRYVGGMVDSSTISAEEGGMVTMSWDGVQFLNMVHNQANQQTVANTSGGLYYGASVTANMPRYSLMQSITNDDVGMINQTTYTAANDGSGYPSTQPYYFSQGTIKFFGIEFARIRSFSLSISNSIEPRYYIGRQGARARGPYETKEGPREYSMSCTVALPDSQIDANSAFNVTSPTNEENATELFKQLLLEGDYGATGGNRKGFTAQLKFDRAEASASNDYIIIDIPSGDGAGTTTAGTSGVNSQGMFINTAPHSITGDNPFQVDLDMIFRSMQIYIKDNQPFYP